MLRSSTFSEYHYVYKARKFYTHCNQIILMDLTYRYLRNHCPNHTVVSSTATTATKWRRKYLHGNDIAREKQKGNSSFPNTLAIQHNFLSITYRATYLHFLDNQNNKRPTSPALTMAISTRNEPTYWNWNKSYQSFHLGSKPTQNLKISGYNASTR